MINISINNNSDSNNYPRLDLDAGQETIQIKLHLRKMCVFGAGNVFKEEEKLMLWKNISPSSGNNCSFPFWGSCKRKECPSRIEIFNGEFPTPSDYRERCVQLLRLEGEMKLCLVALPSRMLWVFCFCLVALQSQMLWLGYPCLARFCEWWFFLFVFDGCLAQGTERKKRKKVKLLSRVRLFSTPWTVPHQAPLSMGFSRQEYWSGLPFTPSGDLPDPGIKPESSVSPALAGGFFTTSTTWAAL